MTPPADDAVIVARFDDLVARPPRSWEFSDPRDTGRADTLAEVIPAIEAAERAASSDWVVMAIAYEASPAFEPAARTAACPPAGTPFVWWTAFGARSDVGPPAFGPSPVIDRTRTPNVLPFTEAVDDVRSRIAAGDVYQVNVTDRIRGHYVGEPLDVYRALTGVQTCAHAAYLDLGDVVIASASPELFFAWDGDTITCRPMKGTAPRHPRTDRDRAVAAALLASDKERAENVMIVDLMRNDLSRLSYPGHVRVLELFTLERYETVWQLTSTVEADVRANITLGDVLTAVFPCGSVTGAPKLAAMQVIADLEAEPRGVYCGAIGYLSPPGRGPRAVFSVPIRTAVIEPATHTYVYGVGGGITWSSDRVAEDREVRAKDRILTRSRRQFDLLETMRLDAGGIAHRDRHLTRLLESAEWFGIDARRERIEAALDALPPVGAPRRLRLLVDQQGNPRTEHHPLVPLPTPARLAVDDVAVRSDDPFCCHKTTFRRHYDEARRRHPGADDVVLVNEHGNVVETTTANLAYRRDGRWFVPPLDDGGLPGVGRAVQLAVGRVAERSLPVSELGSCDELAVVSAIHGWRPAVLTANR